MKIVAGKRRMSSSGANCRSFQGFPARFRCFPHLCFRAGIPHAHLSLPRFQLLLICCCRVMLSSQTGFGSFELDRQDSQPTGTYGLQMS